MKQFLIIVLLLSSFTMFGQKKVRKNIREGNSSYNEQVYNAAEASYKAALDENVSSPEAQYNLGNVYYKQKKWDEALKLYQQFAENPNSQQNYVGHAWHNIGNVMLRKNDYKKSEEAFKKALRINPNDDESRYNLATVQKLLKDKEEQDKKDQDKNKDQDKKDQDKKDQDKKDQDKKDQDKKDQDKKNQDKKDQQKQQPQMSPENIQQMLKAIEQDEKETQERVNQMKAQEKKRKNNENRRQNKDW